MVNVWWQRPTNYSISIGDAKQVLSNPISVGDDSTYVETAHGVEIGQGDSVLLLPWSSVVLVQKPVPVPLVG